MKILIVHFLKTLSLCASLNVRDQVSHPYKRTQSCSSVYVNL